jgi:hypothetical protein
MRGQTAPSFYANFLHQLRVLLHEPGQLLRPFHLNEVKGIDLPRDRCCLGQRR